MDGWMDGWMDVRPQFPPAVRPPTGRFIVDVSTCDNYAAPAWAIERATGFRESARTPVPPGPVRAGAAARVRWLAWFQLARPECVCR